VIGSISESNRSQVDGIRPIESKVISMAGLFFLSLSITCGAVTFIGCLPLVTVLTYPDPGLTFPGSYVNWASFLGGAFEVPALDR
jgi:hypothetical protein